MKKLTARNSTILHNIKMRYNDKQYKMALDIANEQGEMAALEQLLAMDVSAEHRERFVSVISSRRFETYEDMHAALYPHPAVLATPAQPVTEDNAAMPKELTNEEMRELDIKIAKILGWSVKLERHFYRMYTPSGKQSASRNFYETPETCWKWETEFYTQKTDEALALLTGIYGWTLYQSEITDEYCVTHTAWNRAPWRAKTAALAICLAFLAWKENPPSPYPADLQRYDDVERNNAYAALKKELLKRAQRYFGNERGAAFVGVVTAPTFNPSELTEANFTTVEKYRRGVMLSNWYIAAGEMIWSIYEPKPLYELKNDET